MEAQKEYRKGVHKEDGIVSREEANICLTCEEKRCNGNCERLHKEKRRLLSERKAQRKPKPREEFIIPERSPWTKKKKSKEKTDATVQ